MFPQVHGIVSQGGVTSGGGGGEPKWGVTSFTNRGNEHSYTGRAGWVFTPNVDITVSKLRIYSTGGSEVKRAMIHRNSDEAVMAQVDIAAPSGGANEWVEQAITPFELANGVTYTISLRVISGSTSVIANPTDLVTASELTIVNNGVREASGDNRPTSDHPWNYMTSVDLYFTPSAGDIEFVAKGDISGGGASLICPVPAGTTDGDVMLAVVVNRTVGTMPPTPDGWTPVETSEASESSAPKVAVFSRVASSEPASYSLPIGSSAGGVAAILTYRNVSASTPVEASDAAGQASNSTNKVAPSVTTLSANAMLLCFWATRDTNTCTPPDGMTERVDVTKETFPTASVAVAEAVIASPGATGTRTAVSTVSGFTAAVSVALKPA